MTLMQMSISELINCVSQNEDVRQDLWVDYLTNKDISNFIHILDKEKEDDAALDYCWQLSVNDRDE